MYNRQCTDSSWRKNDNTREQNQAAMMEAMAKLGFVPSAPPTNLAAAGSYVKDDDDCTHVAVPVKAYITQNGSAFDAMRGGVGEAVDNAVTRTGRFMIRHAVGFLVLDDWRDGVRKFQEQIRQALALKIQLNYNQTVFRYLYELRRERDATAAITSSNTMIEDSAATISAVPSATDLHKRTSTKRVLMADNSVQDTLQSSSIIGALDR